MRLHLLASGVAAVVVATVIAAATVGPAQAAPACTADALNTLKVPGLTITDAKPVAAKEQTPAHCQVFGSVVTHGEGAPNGLARFSMQMPDAWQQRFLFIGIGGSGGSFQPSANGVDRGIALGKGYVMVITDTGHVGEEDGRDWMKNADGSLNQATSSDFLFRAVHNVTVTGKAFAQSYYGAPVQHSYFDGCSTGGRMALVAAMSFPEDFNGIISGDPAQDFVNSLNRASITKTLLAIPGGYISPANLASIDRRVVVACDTLDGAKDGLVQNSVACTLKPKDLQCKAGETVDCLTAPQVASLEAYIAPLRDGKGRAIYPGWPIAHLVGSNAAMFYTFGVTPPDPSKPLLPWGDKPAPRGSGGGGIADWLGYDGLATVQSLLTTHRGVSDELIARTRSIMGKGEARDPARLNPFFARGGKVISYHGVSDPSIPALRSVQFYNDLIAQQGAAKANANARLFLVPGMQHCGGGAGVNAFDTLSPLEAWVEQGKAPDSIIAGTRAGTAAPRTLPLCPYPQQARYVGQGEVADAKNWQCATAPAQVTNFANSIR